MNNWNGSGFLTRDPDIKTINAKSGEMMMARFSIACQRKGKDSGADFVNCVAYGKNAETLQKWFSKGKGIEIRGHIQTGSYEGKNGKVYTTDVVCDEIEFAKVRKSEESAPVNNTNQPSPNNDTHTNNNPQPAPDDMMQYIPDIEEGVNDLPFI